MLLMGTSKQDMTRIYFLLGVIAVTVCSAMLLDGDTAVQTTGRVQGMCRDDTATNCSSFTSAACLQFKENTARLCPKTCGFCHCYDNDEHCHQFAANCDRFDMLKGGACNLTCGQCGNYECPT
ncbi:uncharacterized protein ZK673.1-like [Dreissena polymorpha]|uniref:ShKT domain-containing protein n=1 Tax=Dreissena polymorpha TaxID=45954 RepID=A0A9D4EE94_DREPO|nr:uncharacterized protein ZK673.1-like [Dreissena polymorpha]KAH3778707.1 hypothetical protein DPMN_180177 [Dreissena polymorpha]